MNVHFRARSTAQLTEYWMVQAPPGWSSLSDEEKLDWLQENIDSADFVSQEVGGEGDRTVLDFHRD
ncbi:MAG TPA: hypothetical protein VEP91_06765 [Solirubrobacterales bacterium]|nr:hypothetical protein [Solirubrobacterales bacterium]